MVAGHAVQKHLQHPAEDALFGLRHRNSLQAKENQGSYEHKQTSWGSCNNSAENPFGMEKLPSLLSLWNSRISESAPGDGNLTHELKEME